MRFNAPTQLMFIISLVLAVAGILSGFGFISAIAGYSFYLMIAAWGLLSASCILKGL